MSVEKCVRFGAALFGLPLLAQAASAADMYYPGSYKDPPFPAAAAVAPPAWQGFYGGLHLGGIWSTVEAADNVVFVAPNVIVQSNQSTNINELFGGGQLGFNLQTGNFVYGVEADLGGMNNGSKTTFILPATGNPITVASDAGWYGDVALRGGMAFGNALFYAKGGFAFFTGGVTVTDSVDNIRQNSGTFTGWTAGAGLEYMISPSWSLKAEYLYFDLGNNVCCFTSSSRFDDSITMHTVKVGVNFHLRSGLPPLN